MYGKKILVSIIIIILVVLMINVSNVSYANPNPADFTTNNTIGEAYAVDDIRLLNQDEQTFIIMKNIIILLIEVINFIISVYLLFKEKLKKLKYVFIILLNLMMIFVTIEFWYKIYSIWNTIIFINLIIQTIIVIYLIKKIKTMKKEGEESVKNRK